MRSHSSLPNGVMHTGSGIGGVRGLKWRRLGLIIGCFVIFFYIYLLTASNGSTNTMEESRRVLEQRLIQLSDEVKSVRDQSDEIMAIAKQISFGNFPLKSDRGIRETRNHPDQNARLALEKLESRLKLASDQVDAIEAASNNLKNGKSGVIASSSSHEYLRRRSEMRVREFGYLVDAQVKKLMRKQGAGDAADLHRFQKRAEEQRFLLLNDLDRLSKVEGGNEWRKKQLEYLGSVVQNRIRKLQNPTNCHAAPKLVCNLNKGCGFGCQAHHVLYCLILAYASGRTLILDSIGWRYSHQGWTAVFKPLSDTCTSQETKNKRTVQWGSHEYQSAGVVTVPIIDALHGRPNFLPQAIPSDLEKSLNHLHGAPFVWFAGQLLTYVMRPNNDMERQIELAKKELGFHTPTVGIHIRRTDKVGTEAAYHAVEEYMNKVETWYRRYELTHGPPTPRDKELLPHGWRKRVFLASDDPRVLAEMQSKYPDYIVMSDNEISRTARISSRYSDRALRGVLIDMFLLASSNHLVCTFSSQVCRVAYELMQPVSVDASAAFDSLDDIYYFGGQNAKHVRALMDHIPLLREEIAFKRGDLIKIAGNHWNGMSKGTNVRTGSEGLFPSYKAEFVVNSAKMGSYNEVPLKD